MTPEGRRVIKQILTNIVGGAIDCASTLVDTLTPALNDIITAFLTAFNTHGSGLLGKLLGHFKELARDAFVTVSAPLIAKGPIEPHQWIDNATEAMGDAFDFGLASWGVTAAFESVLPEKLNVLNGAGPMLATMAGFAEVSGAALGPLLNAAIKQPATYDMNSKLRPLLPDLARALEMHSRRVITDDQLTTLLAFAGVNPTWVAALTAASYRPIQPRALAAVIGEYNFDRTAITNILKFGGYRDQDIDPFINAMVQRGLQPLRQAVINETVTLAGEGLLSDSDVSSSLHSQNLSDDAISLINQHIALRRLHTMARETKIELTAAAKNQLITLDDYARDLAAIGYADAEVQIARNSVAQYLTAKEERAAERELAQEEARVQALNVRQAQQSFKRGEINSAVFAAELAAAGLSVDRIAAYTSLAGVLNEPTLRAGTKLSAFAQKEASAKLAIKALSEEYRKGQLDEPTFRAGLAANAMSPADVDATVAYLDALAIKGGTAAAATVPLASPNGTAPPVT